MPDEIAVIGFDDVDEAAFIVPSLSSVGQRFDEVGALAGRLLLRIIAGEEVPPGPYVAPSSALATRGSCGCRTDVDGLSEPRRATRVPRSPDALHTNLCTELTTSAPGRPVTEAESVVVAMEDLLDGRAANDDAALHGLARSLTRMVPDPEELQRVARHASEYLQELAPADPACGTAEESAAAKSLAMLLSELQTRGYAHRARRLENVVLELSAVAEGLAGSGHDQITSLA